MLGNRANHSVTPLVTCHTFSTRSLTQIKTLAPTEWNYLLYHVPTGTLLKGPQLIRNFTSTMSGTESLVWTGLMSDLKRMTEGWLFLEDDGMPEPPPNIVLRHVTIPTHKVNPQKT